MDDAIRLPSGGRVPGRIGLAPLTNLQSHPDGQLGDDELAWISRRASGGFPWLSTCAAFVSEEGHAWKGQLGIARDEHVEGLTRLARAAKAHGAFAVAQLHHGGAKAQLAPVRLSTVDDEGQRAATAEDLERVIADFVAAAVRARTAGFDGVEIHGANGYLFTQFLAPADNPRTDAWGGSLRNRARLLRDALTAVRAAVPRPFTVGVRLSAVDLRARRGLVLSEAVELSRWLAEDGADFVHLSLSDAAGPPPHEPDAGPVARAIRDALPEDVPVLAAGGLWTSGDVARAREAGVDLPILGKAAIGNPDWPRHFTTAGWAPVRPPWTVRHLEESAVGPAFLDYLRRFPGLVEDGRPA